MKKHIFAVRAMCAAAVLSAALFASGCDKSGEDANAPSMTIEAENSVERFAFSETRDYLVKARNIASASVEAPRGWTAEYDEPFLSVTAPSTLVGTVSSGDIVISYTGTDGSEGQTSLAVAIAGTGPVEDPDPNRPQGSFKIDVSVADYSSRVEFSVSPDNKNYPYWITLTTVYDYESFRSDEEFLADDLDYWFSTYGDFGSMLYTGDVHLYTDGLPNGAYVICAYYVDVEYEIAFGFSRSNYFTVFAGAGSGTPDEPYLGLSYELDNGDTWDGYIEGGSKGKGIIVASVNPNELVTGWYYGLYSKANAQGEYKDDEKVRQNLKSNEAFHNQVAQIFVKDWGTEWELCGFYVDANGNEGPVERLPFILMLEDAADWTYLDYLGDWTVSGTNLSGKKVSYDITFEENMYNESFNVYGFTRTGNDRTYRSPVKVRYNNGVLTFYQNTVMNPDGQGNWPGFLGLMTDPDNPGNGRLYSVCKTADIATGIRAGNKLALKWLSTTYNGETLPFKTFSYGIIIDDDYLMPYDEDVDYVIISDMEISKKGAASRSAVSRSGAFKGLKLR